ncbi:unnamed protein product [Closterium sp. NIES-54]
MNPPPMYITLYFIVTRLLDSFRVVRDHFLALDPTDLNVDLLEKHLLAAETSVVAVGAACGTPCTPFFEGCSPFPLAPSYAFAVADDILGTEDVGAASTLSGKHRSGKGKGGKSGGGGSGGGGGEAVEVAVVAVGVVAGVGASVAAVVAAVGVVAVGVELFRGEVLAVARGATAASERDPYAPAASRREKERPRREPSRERGRSWERSPRRPAFRADRVPSARDRRGEGAEDVGAGVDGHAGGTDQNAWLRESARGTGVEGGSHRDAGVFHSPEDRGRRRDERGHWQGFEERLWGWGSNGSGDAREGGSQENAAQEVTQERDAEGTERTQGPPVEEADEEDGNEVQSEGTSKAEPGPAEERAGASQATVEESRTMLQESRDQDGSRGEGQRAEGSRRQERGARDKGARDAQAPSPHGKEEAERSRTPEKGQHHGEWRVGEFRPHIRRQDQEGRNGGGTRSPGRRQARDAEWRDEPRSPRRQGRQKGRHGAERVSRERRGQQQGERSSTMPSPGRPSQRAQRDKGGTRSPDWRHARREEYGGEGHSPERRQQRSRREDPWPLSPERRMLCETGRGEGQKAREPSTPQWGRAEE